MASFSTTVELNATVDKAWDMKVEAARYAEAVIMPTVSNKSSIVKDHGYIVNVSVDQPVVVGTVGANGAFTETVRTVSSVAVNLNTHVYVALSVEDRAAAQSFFDPQSTFPSDAGKALAVNYDAALAALFTASTLAPVGSEQNPIVFGNEHARTALLRLAEKNVPLKDITFVLPPTAIFLGALADSVFIEAHKIGGGSTTPLITGKWNFPLIGVPAYQSNVLSKVAGVVKAALYHKSAFAIAMQLDHDYRKYDKAPAGVFQKGVATESLFGTVTVRADHVVIINVSQSISG